MIIRHLLEQLLVEEFDSDQFLARMRGVMELVRRGATEGERSAAKNAFTRLMDRAKAEIARMRTPNSGVTSNQIDRFTRALEQITQRKTETPPPRPPPRQAVPRFRAGQWVVEAEYHDIGRIDRIILRGDNFRYELVMWYGTKLIVDEQTLRPATQEEMDAAPQRYLAKYTDGNYLVSIDDNKVGRVAKGGAGWDRPTQSRWYEMEFLDGGRDLIREKFLRPATDEEIAAARPKSQTSSQLNISVMAHYIDRAENSDKIYGIVERNGKVYTFWGGNHKALATKQHASEADAYLQYRSKIRKGYIEMDSRDFAAAVGWVEAALRVRFAKLSESRRVK